ncbi:MAG: prephenate dehydrogenase [Propionibacteriaceae bacterium]
MDAADLSPVVLIGAGLVGASIGQALTAAGAKVHLRDLLPAHARVAASLGAGSVEPPSPTEVRLVVVSVPPMAIARVVSESLTAYPTATVTDVGSVKAPVLHEIWQRAGDLSRYVGSHPMAGSQHSGPMTARHDLFVDRSWVVTPHRRSAPESVQRVQTLVAACRAVGIVMDVDDHDAAVARVSHLPHLVAVLMAGHLIDVPAEHLRLAGQGLRDVTRIAGSDPDLWDQIVATNAGAVVPELKALHAELGRAIAAVEEAATDPSPGGGLHGLLQRGVDGTHRIPGKHGAAATAYVSVVVAIPDTPGALAKLFADVGEAGVNVEDVAIEHDNVRQVGYLALSVTPDQEVGLVATMRSRGWDVQV